MYHINTTSYSELVTAVPISVSMVGMAGTPWTDEENDLVVESYFKMLATNLAGRDYDETEYYQQLESRLNDRTIYAIKKKHQNVTAVLDVLGERWIDDLSPLYHFQTSLMDAVNRFRSHHPEFGIAASQKKELAASRETGQLPIECPPTLRNQPSPINQNKMQAIARKLDMAAQSEYNKALGRAGEERAFAHEQAVLNDVGRPDLASRVRWVSVEDGDGAGYDIESYCPRGETRLIEVKTTNNWEWTPFYITQNELDVAKKCPNEWLLLRLWNFKKGPKAFELRPPLETHVDLIATNYRAQFR